MNFGGTATSQCSEETAHAILDAYVEAGGNAIDTADVYQGGESERIVGRWLAAHPDLRRRLVLMTKARGAVSPATAGPNDVGLSRAHLMAAVEDSLARLQTSYIDVYQMHVWDAGTPLEETLHCLADLIRAGKIRYYGWSNTTGWQVRPCGGGGRHSLLVPAAGQAPSRLRARTRRTRHARPGPQIQKIVETAKRLGVPPPVSLQEQYSLLCRHTEWEVVPVCENEGVALLPWSPLKGGWLSGKITRTSGIPEGSRVQWAELTGSKLQSAPGYSAMAQNEAVWTLIDGLQEIAEAVGGTVAQVAVRWLLHKRAVPAVVIGPKSVEQLRDNLAAARITLSREQVARLDELSAVAPVYPYEMVNRLQAGRHHAAGGADKY